MLQSEYHEWERVWIYLTGFLVNLVPSSNDKNGTTNWILNHVTDNDDNTIIINTATGLAMVGGIIGNMDIMGNLYGTDLSDHHN